MENLDASCVLARHVRESISLPERSLFASYTQPRNRQPFLRSPDSLESLSAYRYILPPSNPGPPQSSLSNYIAHSTRSDPLHRISGAFHPLHKASKSFDLRNYARDLDGRTAQLEETDCQTGHSMVASVGWRQKMPDYGLCDGRGYEQGDGGGGESLLDGVYQAGRTFDKSENPTFNSEENKRRSISTASTTFRRKDALIRESHCPLPNPGRHSGGAADLSQRTASENIYLQRSGTHRSRSDSSQSSTPLPNTSCYPSYRSIHNNVRIAWGLCGASTYGEPRQELDDCQGDFNSLHGQHLTFSQKRLRGN